MMASSQPAVIKLTRLSTCQKAGVCAMFDDLWGFLSSQVPGGAWHAVCEEHPLPCAQLGGMRKQRWMEMDAGSPYIQFWTGSSFTAYAGAKNANDLVDQIRSMMAANPASMPYRPYGGDSLSSAMRVRPIARLHRPGTAEFFGAHQRPSIPAVITGALDEWPAKGWDLHDLVRECGDVRLRGACSPGSDACVSIASLTNPTSLWAGQEVVPAAFFNVTTLGELVAAQQRGQPLYLFDESLESMCPALFRATRAPKYFGADFQQQSFPLVRHSRFGHACGNAYPNVAATKHPSLFVATEGTRSWLHADSKGSGFWMAVISGEKRFRLFDPSKPSCLYPSSNPSAPYAMTFELDAFSPDFARHPRAADCVAWEAVVAAGQLIYIPPTWPHAVQNVQPGIAISYNFVDETSMLFHLQHEIAQLQLYSGDRSAVGRAAVSALRADGQTDLIQPEPTGEEVPDDNVINAISLAAVATLLTPIRLAGTADMTDATWDSFLRANRLEHTAGWNATTATDQLIRWLDDVFPTFELSRMTLPWQLDGTKLCTDGVCPEDALHLTAAVSATDTW